MPHVQTTGFQPLTTTLPGAGLGKDRALQRSLRDSVAEAIGVDAKGRGVHGLAIAIRERLAVPSDGADAVPSVLETLNRALDDAAAKLAAQGVSQDEINAAVSRFKNKLSRELGELTGNVAAEPKTDSAQTAIAARQEVRERFSLDITTTEGDQVSINFRSLNVTDVAAAKVGNATGSAIAFEANVISRGRFQVEVDGNLNQDERTAIANLLDKVDDIAADFFGGDVEAAFAAAARVGLDSDALSAFDVKMSYSKSLAVTAYAKTAALAEPTAPVATPDEDVVVTPAKSVAVTDTPVAKLDPEVTAPASEGTATTAAAAASTAKAASARETIDSFTKDILERLDKDDESKATKFSLRWKVEFLIKAFGSVALTPIEQKAADALGIALDGRTSSL